MKIGILVILLILLVVPVVAQEEQPWCGIQTLYFQHNASTSPPGYEELINRPSGNLEVDENLTITSAMSWVEIDRYITPEGSLDESLSDLAGLRRYRFYSFVSGASGVTQLNFTPYLYRNGILYQKFYSVESEDINDLTVNEYLLSYVSNSTLYFQKGDRIVIIVSAKTTHPSPISVHWVYQGSTHTSHVESGYFVCYTPDISAGSDVTVRDVPMHPAIPVIALMCAAFVLWYKRRQ